MNKEECKRFLKWHSEQTETIYFEDELRLYCWSDVGILRESMMSSRDLMIKQMVLQCGQVIDPFANITIISMCLNIYDKYVTEEHEVFVKCKASGKKTRVQSFVKNGQ